MQHVSYLQLYRCPLVCAGWFWGCSQIWNLVGLCTECSRKVHQHVPQTSEKCLNTQNISCLALYRCAGRFWGCSQSWKQKFSKSDISHKWYLAGLWIVSTHKVHQHVPEMSETHLKTQNIVKKPDFVLCESTIFRDVEPIWNVKNKSWIFLKY